MKLDDIRWAVRILFSPAAHGPDCGCPRHVRLADKPRDGVGQSGFPACDEPEPRVPMPPGRVTS
ncbi:hypothetical protein [Aquamicrobium sp. LC103]|uniref:hypothetical protein n=1 Tax=Aquamicrobium sp. LC103 TaxID=1120658 RepID=UPI00063EADE1|nr:hypothetical protein [Aquamicrobium sp. LC103]TKT81280.1 hypothetical protein XW59_005280 [Aquamicrobium sp. LC103]